MKKIFSILACFCIIASLLTPINAAGGVSVNKSSISIKKGESATFTITASNAAGRIDISTSNGSVATINKSSEWLDNSSTTVTVTGAGVGSATITIRTTDVSDYDGNKVSKTMTISVSVGCASHSWQQTSKSEPTCTTDGKTGYKCSVCGTTKSETSAALGHSVSEWATSKEPDCVNTGISEGTCSRCNNKIQKTIPAKGHTFGGWIETQAPTCTVAGIETRECTVCGEKENRETELAPHVLGEERTVIQEATLTEHGVAEGYCVNCGEGFTEETRCQYTDEQTGTHFDCDEGIFLTGATIEVSEVTEEDNVYETLKTELEEIGGRFVAYKTTAYYEDAIFETNGEIDITFKIPEELGTDVAIMTLDEYGHAQILSTTTDKEEMTAKTTVNKLGTYAIVEISPIIINNIIGGPWVYAGIAEGAIIFILLIMLIVKSKKNKTE